MTIETRYLWIAMLDDKGIIYKGHLLDNSANQEATDWKVLLGREARDHQSLHGLATAC
jgi:hypothetical protein